MPIPTYEGHRIGPESSGDEYYIDFMIPMRHWCVRRKDAEELRAWPGVNTYGAAVRLRRKLRRWRKEDAQERATRSTWWVRKPRRKHRALAQLHKEDR